MAKVIEIAISKNFGQKMINVDSIKTIAGKGLVNDRHFRENNDKKCQITLIEIENINHYNQLFKTSIPLIDFRRNIITEGMGKICNFVCSFLYRNFFLKKHNNFKIDNFKFLVISRVIF